jgi:hypothetical protein
VCRLDCFFDRFFDLLEMTMFDKSTRQTKPKSTSHDSDRLPRSVVCFVAIRLAVCSVVIAGGWFSCGFLIADEPRPIERLGRWSGYGWGDGYHACESSGLRVAADLPPRSYASTFGNHQSRFGGSSCGAGCSQCGHGGRNITFYDRFDAVNAEGFDSSSCDQYGCDGVGGNEHLGFDDNSSDSSNAFSATLGPPTVAPEQVAAEQAVASRVGLVSSRPIRPVSAKTTTLPGTTMSPIKVQASATPQTVRFEHPDDRSSKTTQNVPEVQVARPHRLPPIGKAFAEPIVQLTTTNDIDPSIQRNPFAR